MWLSAHGKRISSHKISAGLSLNLKPSTKKKKKQQQWGVEGGGGGGVRAELCS